MQTSFNFNGANLDGSFINSRSGGGNQLTLWKVTEAFGANNLSSVNIDVGDYSLPPDAVQPTGELLDTLNCRMMTAVMGNDTLGSNGVEVFTSLTTDFGGDARVHLFKVDPIADTLEFEAVFGAPASDYWMACPAADYSGSCAWVFSRTSNTAGGEPELRFVDYDQGVFSGSSSQIRNGVGSYDGFRWGDYFGGQLDWGDYSANFMTPGQPAKLWLYGEFGRNDSWGTHIAATSVFSQGNLSSVTPSTTFAASGMQGGPFTPSSQTYTLTNTGGVGLAYEVTSLPSWLSASTSSGQLFPGTTTVTLSINSTANSLAPGVYTDSILIRDCFNGGSTYSRSVTVTVEPPCTTVVSNATNPNTYVPIGCAAIGQNWVTQTSFTGSYFSSLLVSSSASINVVGIPLTLQPPTTFMLLPPFLNNGFISAGIGTTIHSIFIPNNINLIGNQYHTQAFAVLLSPLRITGMNAITIVLQP